MPDRHGLDGGRAIRWRTSGDVGSTTSARASPRRWAAGASARAAARRSGACRSRTRGSSRGNAAGSNAREARIGRGRSGSGRPSGDDAGSAGVAAVGRGAAALRRRSRTAPPRPLVGRRHDEHVETAGVGVAQPLVAGGGRSDRVGARVEHVGPPPRAIGSATRAWPPAGRPPARRRHGRVVRLEHPRRPAAARVVTRRDRADRRRPRAARPRRRRGAARSAGRPSVDDGGLDPDRHGPPSRTRSTRVAEVGPHVGGRRRAHLAEAVGRRRGDSPAERLEQLEGHRVVGHPQADRRAGRR